METRLDKPVGKIVVRIFIALRQHTQTLHLRSHRNVPFQVIFLRRADLFKMGQAVLCQLLHLGLLRFNQNAIAVDIETEQNILGMPQKIVKYLLLFSDQPLPGLPG